MVFMNQNNEASAKFEPTLREWVYGGFKPAAAGSAASATAQ
jgi:hypothetical protein